MSQYSGYCRGRFSARHLRDVLGLLRQRQESRSARLELLMAWESRGYSNLSNFVLRFYCRTVILVLNRAILQKKPFFTLINIRGLFGFFCSFGVWFCCLLFLVFWGFFGEGWVFSCFLVWDIFFLF